MPLVIPSSQSLPTESQVSSGQSQTSRPFDLITNYIYFYHTDSFLIIPVYPDSVQDTQRITFNSTSLLARSAPIYSFSYAGPRSVQISLNLHRDLMQQTNYKVSNVQVEIGDDYVDTLIKALQAAALPRYDASAKMVDPPVVALRLGNEIYCKGVLTGGISTTYMLPILDDNKYSNVSVAFNIEEVDPYDADLAILNGSFRGLNTTLERSLFGAYGNTFGNGSGNITSGGMGLAVNSTMTR